MAPPSQRRVPADPRPADPTVEPRARAAIGDAALIRRAHAVLAEQEVHRARLTALLAERRALMRQRQELIADFERQSLAMHRVLDALSERTRK